MIFYSKFSKLLMLSFFLLIVHLAKIIECKKKQDDSPPPKPIFPKLLVLSFDGFRYDYLKKYPCPNLNKLKNAGVSVPYLKSVFVTKTFVNHNTIVTGLYPESHGVTDNQVFNPESPNSTLSVNDEAFYDSVPDIIPIWILNEWAGGKSGVMWPGALHPYGRNNSRPTTWFKYSEFAPFNWRIDKAVNLLTELDHNLVFLYFEQPDGVGHAFGPESPEVENEIKKIDDLVGYLLDQLEENGIKEKINLIILSDHGMQEVKEGNVIQISDFLPDAMYEKIGGSPVWNIRAKEGYSYDTIYEILRNNSEQNFFKVYKRRNIPEEWHLKNSPTIQPLILVADLGWVFDDLKDIFNNSAVKGVHGYDNRYPSMRSIFMAYGPSFKRGFVGRAFENIHVFSLMCKLIGIETPSNNGSLQVVQELLLNSGEKSILTNRFTLLFSFISSLLYMGNI